MKYMLDTDICSYAMKQRPERVIAALRQNEAKGICLSSVTAAELWFGVTKSGSRKNHLALEEFLSAFEIFAFDKNAAKVYGKVRDKLESIGKPIGPMDTQIASHAVALNLTLITNNVKEFARVEGLKLENWAE
jgi:tRNA(fMet)-specific endonuclease VapC